MSNQDEEQYETENPEESEITGVQIFFRHHTSDKTYTLTIKPNMLWIEVMKMYIQKVDPTWKPAIGNTNMFKYLRFLHGGMQINEYNKQVSELMIMYKFSEASTFSVVGSFGHRSEPLKRNLDLNNLQDLVKSVYE